MSAAPQAVPEPVSAPKVRQAMILYARNDKGGAASVTVREMRDHVQLQVDRDDDGLGVRKITLTLAEASQLADMLNRIRRRVANRPEWRP